MQLAQVDVELFVQDGVPREAFEFVPPSPDRAHPSWLLSDDTLRSLGWTVGPGHQSPPADHVANVHAPHPYALGPMWEGANDWRARFTHDRTDVSGFVDHEQCGHPWTDCELGKPLMSGSPWRWRLDGLPSGIRCGRAESPAQAAGAAETVADDAGCDSFPHTPLRRFLPGE